MTTVKAGGKDVILPGDGFDAFVDFLFNTPSQPELCLIDRRDIISATTSAKRDAMAAAASMSRDGSYLTTAREGGFAPTPPPSSSSSFVESRKEEPIPSGRVDNSATIVVDDIQVWKAGRNGSIDDVGEEKDDDEALCHRPYPVELTPSYLEFIDNGNNNNNNDDDDDSRRQSSVYDYSDAQSTTSGMGGDSSAWSFSAVGKEDDDTCASYMEEDAPTYESNDNDDDDDYDHDDYDEDDNHNKTPFARTGGDLFLNVMNFEEKVPDENDDGPAAVVGRPYILKYSPSYLSERSDQDDGNASCTWSFSAVGAE